MQVLGDLPHFSIGLTADRRDSGDGGARLMIAFLVEATGARCRLPSQQQRCFASASSRDYVGLASRRTLAILFTVRLGKVSLSRVLPTRYLGRCRLSSAPALSIKIKVSAGGV